MLMSTVETISPAQASEYLKSNRGNRKISQEGVRRLVKAIKGGTWVLNGQPIIISETGRLLDGQHRLTACVIADIPIASVVIKGMADEVFSTIDNGGAGARTAGQILGMAGYAKPSDLAALSNYVYLMENNFPVYNRSKLGTGKEIQNVLNNHPELAGYTEVGVWFKGTSKAFFSFLKWRCDQIDKQKSDEFFKGLKTGAGLETNNPIYLLRERLNANAIAKAQLKPMEYMALVIKAWNLYFVGKKTRQLKWTTDPNSASGVEPFPELAGEKAKPQLALVAN